MVVHRVAAFALYAAGRLMQRLPHSSLVLVACAHCRHAPSRERALDEFVQAVAVSLLERSALGLAVVGEHHKLVWTRRKAAGTFDPAELLVELSQRLQRVGALQP